MFCPLNSKRRQREIVLESVSQRVGGVETINEHCLFSPRNWPRFLLGWLLWLNLPGGFVATYAQSTQLDRSRFTRPVLRVADTARQAPPAPDHPLAAPLRMAREKLAYSQQEIYDYSAILVKRERVGDALLAHQFISLKVRNERLDSQGGVAVPFSVYMYFVGPESLKGREVLWVKGQNKNKLVAHAGSGFAGLLSVWLEPTSTVAMRDQRYPVYYIGMESLLKQYIVRLEKDRRVGAREDFQVQVFKGARVDGRVCTCTQVTHPVHRSYLDNHVTRLFVDDEDNVPIRYVAWDWPTQQGASPAIIEEYSYTKVKLNLGLTNSDFDYKNPSYNF